MKSARALEAMQRKEQLQSVGSSTLNRSVWNLQGRCCFLRRMPYLCLNGASISQLIFYQSVAVGKGLILLCHLISGNHFGSVSMTFLRSVRLERDLLCLWTAFCSEEWGYNCNVGRTNWTCSGLSCLIFPCCFFFLCPLQLALMTGTFQLIKSWLALGLICS